MHFSYLDSKETLSFFDLSDNSVFPGSKLVAYLSVLLFKSLDSPDLSVLSISVDRTSLFSSIFLFLDLDSYFFKPLSFSPFYNLSGEGFFEFEVIFFSLDLDDLVFSPMSNISFDFFGGSAFPSTSLPLLANFTIYFYF